MSRAAQGPRILIATMVGGEPQLTVLESSLAAALTTRGARVDVLLCDAALAACQRAKIAGISPEDLAKGELRNVFCNGCMARGAQVFDHMGLRVMRLSELLSAEDRAHAAKIAAEVPWQDVQKYHYRGLPLGEHAMAGALRFYGRGDVSGEPAGEAVVRRYLEAAHLIAAAIGRAIDLHRYECIVVNHGIYVPHGVTAAVARARNVRLVAWNLAYRKQCAIFSHGDTYHHTLMNEPTEAWESMPWSSKEEARIMDYLRSRRSGSSRDWIWFNSNPDNDLDRFATETGLDWKKPVVGMLTNVVWDAQLHYPANAFDNMIDWVLKTIVYFSRRPDLQLLIRVHPGELAPPGGSTKSRQPIVEEIRKAFPTLPANVFIVGPESPLSTYEAMDRCNAVIIYGTKTGVELTSTGSHVIVAGEAWIRNKGVTADAISEESYFAQLDALPRKQQTDEALVRRARQYAYHFFFRRMIPLPYLEPQPTAWPPYQIRLGAVERLETGNYPGLDVICDGILKGTPFVYPAERLGLHDS